MFLSHTYTDPSVQGSWLLSPSSQPGNHYHGAVATLCKSVLSCAKSGEVCLGTEEMFVLWGLREFTFSCTLCPLVSFL